MVDVLIKSSDGCSEKELSEFQALLLSRSDIETKNLLKRMGRAEKLAFAYVEDFLVGIAAVKYATEGFRRRILQGQDVRLLSELPHREVGWIYVKEDFRDRGVASMLLTSLMNEIAGKPSFSLTTADNIVIRKMLTSRGFSFCGGVSLENRAPYLLYFKKGE